MLRDFVDRKSLLKLRVPCQTTTTLRIATSLFLKAFDVDTIKTKWNEVMNETDSYGLP